MMITGKSVLELSRMLQDKELTATEICSAYLDRINEIDGKIHAFITHDDDEVMRQAKESDERRSSGAQLSPLDGIPIALKDNLCTKGILTSCGSGILRNFIPPYNASSYDMIRQKGMVLLGKMNMDEFAMGSTTETSWFGATRNPHDLERVPGGSSGGAAAAVAAKLAPLALGSDTGGSIRQPASFCGVVGIKPTYGRVSRYGLVAFASSLDQIGPFGRNVKDAAEVLGYISGKDERDATSLDREVDFTSGSIDGNVKGMVIGVPDEYFENIDPEIKENVQSRIAQLESQGAKIERISLKYTEYAVPIYYLIATAEASSNLARYDGVRYGYRSPNVKKLKDLYFQSREEGFGGEVKRRIILGTFSLSSGYYDAYYLKALKGRKLIIDDFTRVFQKVDAIVTPVTINTAFKIGEKMDDPLSMYMSDILTISANLAAIPGISVPSGKDSNGLPIGIQVMGNHFQERTILNVAQAIENNCGPVEPAL